MLKMPRPVPNELIVMRLLNLREVLSQQEKKNYKNLEKGFEGELKFDLLTEKLQNECFVLNGLLLEVNNSEFQIDTSIIFQKTIYLIDVKNFEGDYYYENEKLYFANGDEAKDPLLQLRRCESLFRQLLQKLGVHFHVEAYLVYINPELTLLQAPRSYPIVYPTQLNRFMQKLNMVPSRLYETHEKFANQLISLHKTESLNTKLPRYNYDQIPKRIICSSCCSCSLSVRRNKIVCKKCNHQEEIELAVLRIVEEIKILFPNRKITTNEVYHWCKIIESKKMIGRILKKNFKQVGYGKWSYYE
ncbi:nuclease-related domain-containing protein [Neobacillus vireti]|uniref:NERD domain-containing protein n=1 Tax=Neobacillus vireti LMG 21834 TaxID=1131730 RepID=A0AB94IRE2_9BACI|nr:nuclease-related domain-containing protein [Neobacillus vireti]ETI69645.1 NERD domain-containing protein [Neobacillus vireti LMG 21834]KLT19164.1 nuclease [Neobacillus vireti]